MMKRFSESHSANRWREAFDDCMQGKERNCDHDVGCVGFCCGLLVIFLFWFGFLVLAKAEPRELTNGHQGVPVGHKDGEEAGLAEALLGQVRECTECARQVPCTLGVAQESTDGARRNHLQCNRVLHFLVLAILLLLNGHGRETRAVLDIAQKAVHGLAAIMWVPRQSPNIQCVALHVFEYCGAVADRRGGQGHRGFRNELQKGAIATQDFQQCLLTQLIGHVLQGEAGRPLEHMVAQFRCLELGRDVGNVGGRGQDRDGHGLLGPKLLGNVPSAGGHGCDEPQDALGCQGDALKHIVHDVHSNPIMNNVIIDCIGGMLDVGENADVVTEGGQCRLLAGIAEEGVALGMKYHHTGLEVRRAVLGRGGVLFNRRVHDTRVNVLAEGQGPPVLPHSQQTKCGCLVLDVPDCHSILSHRLGTNGFRIGLIECVGPEGRPKVHGCGL